MDKQTALTHFLLFITAGILINKKIKAYDNNEEFNYLKKMSANQRKKFNHWI